MQVVTVRVVDDPHTSPSQSRIPTARPRRDPVIAAFRSLAPRHLRAPRALPFPTARYRSQPTHFFPTTIKHKTSRRILCATARWSRLCTGGGWLSHPLGAHHCRELLHLRVLPLLVVPDDNSCIFASVALVFEQDIRRAPAIR
jgi:hypothetical protein